MILAYLILAHLLGDFIFQPGKLIAWKVRRKAGILAHSLIHFFLNILLLSPLIFDDFYLVFAIAFGLSFCHFWIDYLKISYEKNNNRKVGAFLLDQFFHFLTIFAAYILLKNVKSSFPNPELVIFLCLAIAFTYVYEIYNFQKLREKNLKANLQLNWAKMLKRLIILILIYLYFLNLEVLN